MATAADNENITERELRDEYRRSGLSLIGWTYQRAIQTDAVRDSLCATVRASRKSYEQEHGRPAPMQQALI